jgi:hypothetical protein
MYSCLFQYIRNSVCSLSDQCNKTGTGRKKRATMQDTWKAPTIGADGTSPKTCITTVDIAIDNGLNTGVTHRNVTKFTGPCKFTPTPQKDFLLSTPCLILMSLEYNKRGTQTAKDL